MLPTHLATLEHSGLIRLAHVAPELAYLFRHVLVQEAAYGSLLRADRKQLHGVVAEIVEGLVAERPEERDALLAFHYARAEVRDKALHYLRQAADQARARYANADAIQFYTEALTFLAPTDPHRFDVLLARASVYDVVGYRTAQRADVEALLALAEKLNQDTCRYAAQLALADFYLTTQPALATAPARAAGQLAQQLSDPVREAHALRRLGVSYWEVGEFEQALVPLEEAAQRFQAAQLFAAAADCLQNLAITHARLSNHAAAQQTAQAALTLSRQAGDRRLEALSLRRLAVVYSEQGEHAFAITMTEAALTLHRVLGDRYNEIRALRNLSLNQLHLGQFAASVAVAQQSLALARATDALGDMMAAADALMRIYLSRGEVEPLAQALNDLLVQLPATNLAGQAQVRTLLVQLWLEVGHYSQAGALLAAQTPQFTNRLLITHFNTYEQRAHWHAAQGDYAAARQCLADLVAATSNPVWRTLVLAQQAQLEWRAGYANAGAAQVACWRTAQTLAHTVLAQARHNELALRATQMTLLAWFQLELDHDPAGALARVQATPPVQLAYEYGPNLWRWWAQSRIYRAAGQTAAAATLLRQALDRLTLVAERFTDPTLRAAWLAKDTHQWIVADGAAFLAADG